MSNNTPTHNPVPEEVELKDQWGESLTDMESRYDCSFSDVERHVILNVHSHSSCATGIWIEGELDDIVQMVLAYAASQRQATIKEVVERVRTEVVGDDEQLAQKLADVRRLGFNTSSEIVANNRVRNKLRAKQRAALKKIEEEM